MCEQLAVAAVTDGITRAIVDSDDTTNRMNIRKNSTGIWLIFAGIASGGFGSPDSNFNLVATLINGASTEMWINGASLGTSNAGTQNADGLTIGARFDGAAQWWDGDIATVAIADPSHDTTARQAVEAALGSYWSIP
jgi:hypothetical protein